MQSQDLWHDLNGVKIHQYAFCVNTLRPPALLEPERLHCAEIAACISRYIDSMLSAEINMNGNLCEINSSVTK